MPAAIPAIKGLQLHVRYNFGHTRFRDLYVCVTIVFAYSILSIFPFLPSYHSLIHHVFLAGGELERT